MRLARAGVLMMMVLGGVAGGVLPAEAIPIAPGTVIPGLGIPFPGGTELASVYYPDESSVDLVATLSSAVFQSDGGTLDFYYQVINNSPTPNADEVFIMTMSSFREFITDVWFVLNGSAVTCSACGGSFADGTQDPLTVNRSNSGSVVAFNFPNSFTINAGETSLALLIRTNATNYSTGSMSVIASGTVTKAAFQPVAAPVTDPGPGPVPVPEPASLALLGMGLAAAAAAKRRRQAL